MGEHRHKHKYKYKHTILQQATQELDKNICDIFPLKVLFFYTTVTQEDASMETITFEGGQSLI